MVHEIVGRNAKRFSNSFNVLERDVSLAALYRTDVGPMESAEVG